jgi:hypothetical protein
MRMDPQLVRREVVPFVLSLAALLAGAVGIDALLHGLDAVWIGRYLGIPGLLLIIGSFGYSLRKRKWIRMGKPAGLLRAHERLAWLGSFLVLVHAGIHFNAILAWLAVAAMLLNVGSGLTGGILLDRARRRLAASRGKMRQHGLTEAEVGERTYWDSLTFDAVSSWRRIHFPITLAFTVLSLAHIAAVFRYWSWR